MKNTALKVLLTAAVLIPLAVYAQPRPGNPTTATVITKAEIDKISATEQSQTTRDENARVVDIGDGWSMELGIIHRAKQHVLTVGEAKAQPAASRQCPGGCRSWQCPGCRRPRVENKWPIRRRTHFRAPSRTTIRPKAITSSPAAASAFIDGNLLNGRHSTNNPDGGPNGPGCGGGVAVGSRKVELKVGDVLIVPPGVIHGWFDIPDHVDYLSFRPSHGVMKNGWVNPTIASK